MFHNISANCVTQHLVPNMKCNRAAKTCFHTAQLLKMPEILPDQEVPEKFCEHNPPQWRSIAAGVHCHVLEE